MVALEAFHHGIMTEAAVAVEVVTTFQITCHHPSLVVGSIVVYNSCTTNLQNGILLVPSTEGTWDDETTFTSNQNDGMVYFSTLYNCALLERLLMDVKFLRSLVVIGVHVRIT